MGIREYTTMNNNNSYLTIYHTLPPVALKHLVVVIKSKQRPGNTFSSCLSDCLQSMNVYFSSQYHHSFMFREHG